MTQEIMDAIAKSVPSMQMEALKAELKKAEDLPSITAQYEARGKKIEELSDTINTLQIRARAWENLATAEKALSLREQKLEVELLKKDLTCKQNVIDSQERLMMAVFRNPIFRKTMNGQEPCNNAQYAQTVQVNRDESTTIE
jgi:hypothetical protein